MARLVKGHTWNGPDGQGYRLTRDVKTGDMIRASDFEAFGGAPKPEQNCAMPQWLAAAIEHDMIDARMARN